MKGDAPDIIDVVETAYRIELDERAWMQALAESIQPHLDHDLGTMVLAIDMPSPDAMSMRGWAHAGSGASSVGDGKTHDPALAGAAILSKIPAEVQWRTVSQGHRMVTTREAYGEHFDDWWPDSLAAAGIHDFVAVLFFDPALKVAFQLGAPLPKPWRPDEDLRALWQKVSVHALAGYRLCTANREGGPLDSAEAILDLGGNTLHAERPAQGRFEREALRVASKAIDRARSSLRKKRPDEALELWRGLVAGTWSLVDYFDSDGKRFLLAQRNDPALAEPVALSRRERQVATYAAFGHANKLIAYQLGLAVPTVARHLRRAMDKLGLRSRSELIRLAGFATPDAPE